MLLNRYSISPLILRARKDCFSTKRITSPSHDSQSGFGFSRMVFLSGLQKYRYSRGDLYCTCSCTSRVHNCHRRAARVGLLGLVLSVSGLVSLLAFALDRGARPEALPLAMDDYMKEMMDLKTLVTKTLEKKGVLARIRAELRANVFQAIEEQDHMTESEGGEGFALLGQCSARAKQLHATPAGKLLTGLLCEYLEWCELDRTLHVYLPELNQPKPYSRSELEELLEINNDKNSAGGSTESRPLLLEVLEGYLKSETTLVKDSYAVSSSNFQKSSKASSKLATNGLDIGDEDLDGALESRLNLSK